MTDSEVRPPANTGIAIIGMACRFPGAGSAAAFWENLCRGTDSITHYSREQLLAAGLDPALAGQENFVGARGIIEAPDCFDAAFFGIPRREAEMMDPQHRLFLQCCWHALEDAGYAQERLAVPVGVWGGSSTGMRYNTYLMSNLRGIAGTADEDAVQAMLGNGPSYLTSRVSFKLNLTGPSMAVQTACSTSLVAIAEAWRSLMDYGCDMALAGGVSVSFPQVDGYLSQEGDIGSPDGCCRPFDAAANGTVFSDGVGVVLLKRLDDAVADGDHIYAVIRGAAVNNDGGNKMSFAAPSVDGQAEVIQLAHGVADVTPQTIGYVETHGTATPLGDPIEVEGLRAAFGADAARGQYCALGSVKSNIGHLEAAAGVASVIKTALCLQHGMLVPTAHYRTPNPVIDFGNSPFRVCDRLEPWVAVPGSPRRAGVSGFGIGGTNAHLVLEEAPPRSATPQSAAAVLLQLSARDTEALRRAAGELAAALDAPSPPALEDAAFTLREGRNQYRHRLSLVCTRREGAVEALRRFDRKQLTVQVASDAAPSVVFLLPGVGTQYPGMGRGLCETDPEFRAAIERGMQRLRERSGIDLAPLWFPAPGQEEAAEREFLRPTRQLPAIFILECALAEKLQRHGIVPDALLGHSLGENTAACLAGVLSWEDALGLVTLRGEIFERAGDGAMLGVSLASEQLEPMLGADLEVASYNADAHCAVTGPRAAIEALRRRLEQEGIDYRPIAIDGAAHSRLLEPHLHLFGEYLRGIRLQAPRIAMTSNRSGGWMSAEQATDPGYWVEQLRRSVHFGRNVLTARELPNALFVEVGAGKALASLARAGAPEMGERIVSCTRHAKDDSGDWPVFLGALGRLWGAGATPQWEQTGRRIPLPGYPFERKPYLVSVRSRTGDTRSPALPPVHEMRDAAVAVGQEPETVIASDAPAIELVLQRLRKLFLENSGLEAAELDNEASFVDLGFDSLSLTQINLRIRKELGVKLTFRQLFDEAPTLAALSAYVESHLDEEALAELRKRAGTRSAASPAAPAAPGGSMGPAIPASRFAALPASHGRIGPYRPLQKDIASALDEKQAASLAEFMRSYQARTPRSKALTAGSRQWLADPRAMGGFKTIWKEICYPIAAEVSKGARMRDIDGNEYIDCVGGFGAAFFGHGPDFVLDAIRRQMEVSVDYGPQSLVAGDYARRICAMTQMDRASFCNTGSEAVLAAMRIARTATGNDLIVTFSGAYHGILDEVLVKVQVNDGLRRNAPIAPGIPPSASANLVVLEYGDPASLEIIAELAGELAAVMVEPIQSRRPELQPGDFLRELRRVTREHGVPLIFDEVITGFRLHPRGAQHWFGVDADIACYGKVIGGGMPIGVIAGKAAYMDGLDGGMWNYGDDSVPEAGVTYFAGTFVRHPVTLAAVGAVLDKLEREGPAMQAAVNRRSALLCERISRAYQREGIPVELVYFGSVILPRYRGNPDWEGLYFYHLRYYGVHIWEGRPGFLTLAHGEAEMQELESRFLQAGIAMREAGFFPEAAAREPEEYPWTDAQREIWLACRLGENSAAAYNEQVIFEIPGPIDAEVLELAFDRTVNHHPSLRCVVNETESGMRALPCVATELRVEELGGEASEDPEREIRGRALAHLLEPFDYHGGPLIRALLLRVAPGRHVLALSFSHLVCDGWSVERLSHDLARFYTGILTGRSPGVQAAPTLGEFMQAVRDRRTSDEHSRARDYWLDVFRTLPPELELPCDGTRPRVRSFAGERHEYALDPALMQGARSLARQRGCTSFVLLLAVFEILMQRLSGQDDIAIGIPIAGQPRLGMPDMVAHDVTFVPLRARIDTGLRFTDFLEQVRRDFMEAESHLECAYGELLQLLPLRRDASRTPLASVSFNVDTGYIPPDFAGALARFRSGARSLVKFDLLFNLIDGSERSILEIDRYAEVISAATLDRWVGHYEAILRSVLSDPGQRLSEMTLPAEPTAGTGSVVSTPPFTEPFLARFARSAVLRPEHPAVRCGGQALSYARLDELSTRLAHELRARGIRRGSLVGVHMQRSALLPVALIGVWKAGAGYVPLDPDYPAERLEYMVHTAKIALLLTDRDAADAVPAYQGARLALDAGALQAIGKHAGADNDDTNVVPAADDIAYVIFTSGSTGKPKGVMIPHRAVSNFLGSMAERPGLSSDDRLLAVTTLSFDIAVLELFLPLFTGATCVIAESRDTTDSRRLAGLIESEDITAMQATPTTWRMLLLDGWQGHRHLRALCGGEALAPGLARDLLPRVSELWNMYGPTETTVWSTCCRIEDPEAQITIGQPIAGTVCHVLDALGHPQPPGVPGELWIGGTGVALGYIGRDDLSAERFVPDPLAVGTGARCYRTGDIVRRLPDGRIEYLQRADTQIKLRGFRIEAGEIEAVLTTHPQIAQAIVAVRDYGAGDARLVAWVVPRSSAAPTGTELRQHLRTQLPEYMLPQHFVPLAQLPLTDNGKIDRKALPDPLTIAAIGESRMSVAPATDTERFISASWSELLGVPEPGRESYFFDIGGHSLAAMDALARIEQRYGARLDIHTLLLNSLAQIASLIDAAPRNVQSGSSSRKSVIGGLFRRRS